MRNKVLPEPPLPYLNQILLIFGDVFEFIGHPLIHIEVLRIGILKVQTALFLFVCEVIIHHLLEVLDGELSVLILVKDLEEGLNFLISNLFPFVYRPI